MTLLHIQHCIMHCIYTLKIGYRQPQTTTINSNTTKHPLIATIINTSRSPSIHYLSNLAFWVRIVRAPAIINTSLSPNQRPAASTCDGEHQVSGKLGWYFGGDAFRGFDHCLTHPEELLAYFARTYGTSIGYRWCARIHDATRDVVSACLLLRRRFQWCASG